MSTTHQYDQRMINTLLEVYPDKDEEQVIELLDSFKSSRTSINNEEVLSTTPKTEKNNLYCENIKFLKFKLKNYVQVHNLVTWTCKKCDPCLRYAVLQRSNKIRDKFSKHKDKVNSDGLWLLTVPNMMRQRFKPVQITGKLKYYISKYDLKETNLLLYGRHKDNISYLTTGYIRLDNLDHTITKISKNKAIDFFKELNTKFLGPFYADVKKPKLSAETLQFLKETKYSKNMFVIAERQRILDACVDITKKGLCRCGLPWSEHEIVLTSKDEILHDMVVIHEYQEDFEQFKIINFHDYAESRNHEIGMEVTA